MTYRRVSFAQLPYPTREYFCSYCYVKFAPDRVVMIREGYTEYVICRTCAGKMHPAEWSRFTANANKV
jgi:hypothetical protein